MPSWLKLIEQLAPIIVAAAVPGAGPVLASVITAGIHSAEEMVNASSGEKLQHSIEIANATAAGINAVRPNTLDPKLVNATAISLTNTIVDTANLIHNTPIPINK
jgi:hypothetical protein